MKKRHWTQTRAGRARMAEIAHAQHKTRKPITRKRRGNNEIQIAFTFGWITAWLEANKETIRHAPTLAATELGTFILNK